LLNIPFLKKLARVMSALAWVYLAVTPVLAALARYGDWRYQREIQSSMKSPNDILLPPQAFPWANIASGVVSAVAYGVMLLIVVQLVYIAIRAIEGLKAAEQSKTGVTGPQKESASQGKAIGTRTPGLPEKLLSVRRLSRFAWLLGWVSIAVPFVHTPGQILVAVRLANLWHLSPFTRLSNAYFWPVQVLVGRLVFGVELLLASQGLLWLAEVVVSLRSLSNRQGPQDSEEPQADPA